MIQGHWCRTVQADDIREKYLLKAAGFVTSSRDAWMKKRQRVVGLRQKVRFCSVEWAKPQYDVFQCSVV